MLEVHLLPCRFRGEAVQSGMVLILLIGLLGTESLEGTTDAWHPEVLSEDFRGKDRGGRGVRRKSVLKGTV